jgi:hypothetical protein
MCPTRISSLVCIISLVLLTRCELASGGPGKSKNENAADKTQGNDVSCTAKPGKGQTQCTTTFSDPALGYSENDIRRLFGDPSCTSFADPNWDESLLPRSGLFGWVRVPPKEARNVYWNHLDKFLREGEVSGSIFVDSLNIPTRIFNGGFPTLSGTLLSDGKDRKLVEYFNINFYGFLSLPESQPAGDYEFAVISDDGVRVNFDDQIYIDDPMAHPTRMACSGRTLSMTSSTQVELEVNYFQGPRHHIALMLLWRPASTTPDPLCRKEGNTLFFDPNVVPSKPQQAFKDLESRGWSVVPATAFEIPLELPFNPCTSERVSDILKGGVY